MSEDKKPAQSSLSLSDQEIVEELTGGQEQPLTEMPPKKKDTIDESSPALSKFLSNPNSYVSYISPQLLSDGSNITQWIDSIEDLAALVFGIKKFLADEKNFSLLSDQMDRSLHHIIKTSISLDLKPILKETGSSLEAIQTVRKNFHKLTRARQLELINSLIWMEELSALGIDIAPEVQGLFLQALTSPPTGTSRTQLNNLILAATEKTDE
ncbi:hypothetical protein PTTG_30416, partial [Puccinia triticina 1-1 BBBD Race 1]